MSGNTIAPTGQELVLVTGISGSGKSVALHALEDAGYYCVDNLPPELLRDFVAVEQRRDGGPRRVAIAVDVRSAGSLPHLLPMIGRLRSEGIRVRPYFLDASTESLVRRFSETRRPHPLSADEVGAPPRALVDLEGGQPALEEGLDLRQHLADFRLPLQVGGHRRIAAVERTQFSDVVGIRQHAQIKDEIGVQRHAVLEGERFEDQRQRRAARTDRIAQPARQLRRPQLARVDHRRQLA